MKERKKMILEKYIRHKKGARVMTLREKVKEVEPEFIYESEDNTGGVFWVSV